MTSVTVFGERISLTILPFIFIGKQITKPPSFGWIIPEIGFDEQPSNCQCKSGFREHNEKPPAPMHVLLLLAASSLDSASHPENAAIEQDEQDHATCSDDGSRQQHKRSNQEEKI